MYFIKLVLLNLNNEYMATSIPYLYGRNFVNYNIKKLYIHIKLLVRNQEIASTFMKINVYEFIYMEKNENQRSTSV